jgi:periplasmic divalent cation tolerance protein
MTDFSFIYITTKNVEEAQRISRILLEERFVACVNIIEKIISQYWWEGELTCDEESLIIAKTKQSLAAEVIEKVKSIHSYSCPCIVVLPIEEGNPDFLAWIRRETR